MSAIESRVAKLEENMAPEVPMQRRVIQIYASIDLPEEEVNGWLLDQGVDLFNDDLIVVRSIVGIEPGTMARVYTGVGTIDIYDPATGERQRIAVGGPA